MKKYAVLFKKLELSEGIIYIPFDIIIGEYNKDRNSFISGDTELSHIIENNYTETKYGYSDKVTELINNNPLIPLCIAKKIILKYLNKFVGLGIFKEDSLKVLCPIENPNE